MGIIYKLKKHKDLMILDLNKQTTATTNVNYCNALMEAQNMKQCSDLHEVHNSEQCIGESVVDESAVTSDKVDMQFTAEHVLQLCKFLAEKSRKNKNLYKQQKSPLKMQATIQSHFTYDEISFTEDTLELIPNAHATNSNTTSAALIPNTCEDYAISNHILQANNSNNSTTTTTTATTCSQEYNHPHQQGKRDILLKIRHQIFERKRQRQLAHMQQRFGVWRPW